MVVNNAGGDDGVLQTPRGVILLGGDGQDVVGFGIFGVRSATRVTLTSWPLEIGGLSYRVTSLGRSLT